MRVYYNITTDDGSVLWLKNTGTAKPEGAKTAIKGVIEVVGGKGRFAGQKAMGSSQVLGRPSSLPARSFTMT